MTAESKVLSNHGKEKRNCFLEIEVRDSKTGELVDKKEILEINVGANSQETYGEFKPRVSKSGLYAVTYNLLQNQKSIGKNLDLLFIKSIK